MGAILAARTASMPDAIEMSQVTRDWLVAQVESPARVLPLIPPGQELNAIYGVPIVINDDMLPGTWKVLDSLRGGFNIIKGGGS
jgi:hypothetical protein